MTSRFRDVRLSRGSFGSLIAQALELFLHLLKARFLVFVLRPRRLTRVSQQFLLCLAVFENGFLLLSQVGLHLNLLIQLADRGLLYSLARNKLGHLGLDKTVEGYSRDGQVVLVPLGLRIAEATNLSTADWHGASHG